MAYIQPSGKIELMKNVPLTPEYNHTYYFYTEQQQYNYFSSKVTQTFNNQMYTRVSNGVCRIEGEAELLKECNYMRFNNNLPSGIGISTKNYYAFITNVEYINHNVTEIHFMIDELQTWMFQTNFEKCFIERQHGETDNRGDNIVPEPLQCGDYVVAEQPVQLKSLGTFKYVLVIGTYTIASNPISRPLYVANTFNGLYSGTKYLIFDNADSVRQFINAQEFSDGLFKGLIGTDDLWSPICLFAFPSSCIAIGASETLGGASCNLVDADCYTDSISISSIVPTQLGTEGYKPNNKKLLTYPYVLFKVDLGCESKTFKYENCENPKSFGIAATVNPNPEIKVFLQGYNGVSDPNEYSLTLDTFPNLNLYESGIFAGAGQLIGNAIKTAIAAYASYVPEPEMAKGYQPYFTTTELANVPPSLGDDYLRIKHTIDTKTREDMIAEADETEISLMHDLPINMYSHNDIAYGGKAGSIATDMANHMLHFNLFKMSIKGELAERIDEYFSKYGYAQNRVAVPNVCARLKWTYIKTRGCLVTGSMPTKARTVIQNALDRGITYWNQMNATVGDYDFANNGVLNG